MIELIDPDARFRESYLAATDEFGDAHRDGDGLWVEEAEGDFPGYAFTRDELATDTGFRRFVDNRIVSAREDAPRRAGWVPCTFLWITEGDEYLGSLAIRHRLNDYLRETGGHIGYSVRPSARRRGVATEALRLARPRAANLGVDPVLITCAAGNEPSRRTILANGGRLDDIREDVERYWIGAEKAT